VTGKITYSVLLGQNRAPKETFALRSRKNWVFSSLWAIGVLAAAFLPGCGGGGGGGGGEDPPPPSGQAKWTVLVFLNAANSLEPYALPDMNEMEMVGSTESVNIVVQLKRLSEPTNCRRYYIRQDFNTSVINSPVVQYMGSVDMGSPLTLSAFIEWGQMTYPADHYLLVVWDHGDGWRSRALESPVTRGISVDDVTHNYIHTNELGAATQAATPLDIIAFDACLMQMAEVAYELRDSATMVVGSEENVANVGYPYDSILSPLTANPDLSPAALADVMVEQTIAVVGPTFPSTHSALLTSELSGLTSAVDTLAAALIANQTTHAADLQTARGQAQDYGIADNKDLWHYADRVATLTGDATIIAAANSVKAAVEAAVIAAGHSGFANANSHGIAVYVPAPTMYLSTYSDLDWSADTDWDAWLQQQDQ
jgi:hypothetical protein